MLFFFWRSQVATTTTYSAALTGDCATWDPTGNETDVAALAISTGGSFSTIVCGTGTASSTSQAIATLGGPGSLGGLIDPDQDGSVTEQIVPELPLKVNYDVTFVGGQGHLTVVDTASRPTTHADGFPGGNNDDTGQGYLTLTPLCGPVSNVTGTLDMNLADA
jgi:hypothetical protein